MEKEAIQQICEDSVKLVSMTSGLIDEKKGLEQKTAALEAKVTVTKEAFKKGASEWAGKLVQRGLMQEAHKEAFVNDLVDHPDRVFAIAEKVANISMQSIGRPAGTPSADSADPIVRFAFGAGTL